MQNSINKQKTKTMANPIKKNLKHIHELLAEAKFIEAMETYLHDDVELREANGNPKKGKQFNLDFEHDFIDNQLAEFIRYEVKDVAVQGNTSMYTAIMELKLKDGSTMLSEQAVATQWKDGKIYRERYYHA
jgi:hypothetical protein